MVKNYDFNSPPIENYFDPITLLLIEDVMKDTSKITVDYVTQMANT